MKKSEYKRLKNAGKKLHIKPQPQDKKDEIRNKKFEYFDQRAEDFHNNCE